MNIRVSIARHLRRVSLIAISALASVLLGACGQVVAAQNAVPESASRTAMAATAKPTASATTQPTTKSAAEPTASATAQPVAIATPQTEIEFSGILSGLGNRMATIDGKTVSIVGAEVKGTLTPGATVKVHALVAVDGSLVAREIELVAAPAPPAPVATRQSAGDDGPTHDANDDRGADGATHDANDDHGVDGATHDANDDHGVDGATHDANDDRGGSGHRGENRGGHGGSSGHGGGDDH